MRSFAIVTFGCRVNQYDSRAVASALSGRGWVERAPGEADVLVVNACSVTARGSRKVRQAIYKAARSRPGRTIYVMGCVVPSERSALLAVPEVRAVVPAPSREAIVRIVTGAEADPLPPPSTFGERARAWVKVQDGCNKRCTYCVVPSLRGPSRSRPPGSVREEIASLSARGVPEVWLVGTHLSSWGGGRLEELLESLDGVFTVGVSRLRLGTLAGQCLTERFLRAVAARPWICPYFHLSLQSGSRRIRKAMGRSLSPEELCRRVRLLRALIPHASFGADVLVGFPGETEEDFRKTVEVVRELGCVKLHVFPFSPRPGTPAWIVKPRVSEPVLRRRVEALLECERHLWRSFAEKLTGKVVSVAVEQVEPEAEGYSEHYVRVRFRAPEDCTGRLVRVVVHRVGSKVVEGTVLRSCPNAPEGNREKAVG